MRTVVKAVFRSLSASAAANVVNMESQLRSDISQQLKRKDNAVIDSLSFSMSSGSRNISRSFEINMKTESLSPIYKLTNYEESCFEELQDKECDYYPNNSTKGDLNILNMIGKNNSEQNVNSNDIIFSLKNIRFVNSIVFSQDHEVYLTTANYIQRLLHIKAIKKDLMQFIAAAMYDLALEKRVGKALAKEDVSLLLSLTNIPINHIEDFSRMKSLLVKQLNNDLESISITDYLQILLKCNLTSNMDNIPDSHHQLIDIASILATSCELTHFTLACQAISLINVAARHVSFDTSFATQFADVIARFPMIFTSPVRLHQFAKLDNVCEESIKQCTESMVRFVAKYYEIVRSDSNGKLRMRRVVVEEGSSRLGTVMEDEEVEDDEQGGRSMSKKEQKFNVNELIEKLRRVRLALNSQINGKQKQRQRRIKKKLSRQLKKYDRADLERVCMRRLLTEDDDSAISSSSDVVSPSNSPLST